MWENRFETVVFKKALLYGYQKQTYGYQRVHVGGRDKSGAWGELYKTDN